MSWREPSPNLRSMTSNGSLTHEARRRLVVLGFHKIGSRPDGRDTWFYISTTRFGECLQWLAGSRWQVIDANRFLTGLAFPESLPERSVLLTFDDAYSSLRHTALPL